MIKEVLKWKCDRCKTEAVTEPLPGAKPKEPTKPNGWDRIGRPNTRPFDLCPECIAEFDAWIEDAPKGSIAVTGPDSPRKRALLGHEPPPED